MTFANGGSITLNDSNIAPSITENAKTISVSYPKNENEVSNVYIFIFFMHQSNKKQKLFIKM